MASDNTTAYRGFFRFLTEQHIAFKVTENDRWVDGDAERRSMWSSCAGVRRRGIDQFVRDGGRVIVAGSTATPLPVGTVVGRRTTQGYWRIRERDAFPSLRDTDLLGQDLNPEPCVRP